jgi:hypothetical protein
VKTPGRISEVETPASESGLWKKKTARHPREESVMPAPHQGVNMSFLATDGERSILSK